MARNAKLSRDLGHALPGTLFYGEKGRIKAGGFSPNQKVASGI
jgi:hypothetical protein